MWLNVWDFRNKRVWEKIEGSYLSAEHDELVFELMISSDLLSWETKSQVSEKNARRSFLKQSS